MLAALARVTASASIANGMMAKECDVHILFCCVRCISACLQGLQVLLTILLLWQVHAQSAELAESAHALQISERRREAVLDSWEAVQDYANALEREVAAFRSREQSASAAAAANAQSRINNLVGRLNACSDALALQQRAILAEKQRSRTLTAQAQSANERASAAETRVAAAETVAQEKTMELASHMELSATLAAAAEERCQNADARTEAAEQRAEAAEAALAVRNNESSAAEARLQAVEAQLSAMTQCAESAEATQRATAAKLHAAEDREAGLVEELERARMVAQTAQYKAQRDVDAARQRMAEVQQYCEGLEAHRAELEAWASQVLFSV